MTTIDQAKKVATEAATQTPEAASPRILDLDNHEWYLNRDLYL